MTRIIALLLLAGCASAPKPTWQEFRDMREQRCTYFGWDDQRQEHDFRCPRPIELGEAEPLAVT